MLLDRYIYNRSSNSALFQVAKSIAIIFKICEMVFNSRILHQNATFYCKNCCYKLIIQRKAQIKSMLFEDLVYFINMVNTKSSVQNFDCLSSSSAQVGCSYLIANAHNDFAENFHFSNSSLSTVAPSIVPSCRVGKSLRVVGGKGFFFFLICTVC